MSDEHGPTELADIFGGYLCLCGESWTRFHEEQTSFFPPETHDRSPR